MNSPVTRRIEPDPEHAPIITKLFDWYARGNVSRKALTKKAAAAGPTNRSNGKPLVRAKIHQLLQNPIYSGDFMWLGSMYEGLHQPLIGATCLTAFSGVRGREPSTARHERFVTNQEPTICAGAIGLELTRAPTGNGSCSGALSLPQSHPDGRSSSGDRQPASRPPVFDQGWAWPTSGGVTLFVLVLGIVSLTGFAIAPTRVESAFAGRAYAAYGWHLHRGIACLPLDSGRPVPTRADVLGAALAIIGALVIICFAVRVR